MKCHVITKHEADIDAVKALGYDIAEDVKACDLILSTIPMAQDIVESYKVPVFLCIDHLPKVNRKIYVRDLLSESEIRRFFESGYRICSQLDESVDAVLARSQSAHTCIEAKRLKKPVYFTVDELLGTKKPRVYVIGINPHNFKENPGFTFVYASNVDSYSVTDAALVELCQAVLCMNYIANYDALAKLSSQKNILIHNSMADLIIHHEGRNVFVFNNDDAIFISNLGLNPMLSKTLDSATLARCILVYSSNKDAVSPITDDIDIITDASKAILVFADDDNQSARKAGYQPIRTELRDTFSKDLDSWKLKICKLVYVKGEVKNYYDLSCACKQAGCKIIPTLEETKAMTEPIDELFNYIKRNVKTNTDSLHTMNECFDLMQRLDELGVHESDNKLLRGIAIAAIEQLLKEGK